VERASRALSVARWVFMPLGLCALVAVGVHAAADTLDDRLLAVLDAADGLFDRVFGSFSLTETWVQWIGAKERTFVARSLTLVWELVADVILAVPALGYVEEGDLRKRSQRLLPLDSKQFPALVERVRERPTLLRIARPLATAAVTVAGACALARMVQGATYLSVRNLLPDGVSGSLARLLAVVSLALLIASFGWRAFLRSIQHSDGLADEHADEGSARFTVGWKGTAVVLPLAVAALLEASPVLSFFR
jgi:hypothetical protein